MLVHARMKRVLVASALVAASSGVASAGGYIGLGIGTGPSLSRDGKNVAITSNEIKSDGRSARLIGGFRFGRFAVEAALGGFDAATQLQTDGSFYESRIYQVSLSGKYNLPLSDGFEAFGRLGVQRTSFSMEDSRFDADGTGLMLGAGIEYRVKATGISVWMDYQYGRATLDGELIAGELSARMWTLGATIGF